MLSLSASRQKQFLDSLNETEAEALLYDWSFWGRPEQHAPPGDWRTWLVLAGRGWGKTRTGVEWVRENVESGKSRRVALVAPTAADVRDVCIEGESGLLAISPPSFRPLYEPSKRRVTWPNGAIATTYSADEPERLRGPQHDLALCDEPSSWRYPESLDMLRFGLRLGKDPRMAVTGTPKPVRIVRELLADATTVVTRGSSYDNRANLAPAFFDQIVAKYEGTRLGRQELNAELLEDNPDALWQRQIIEAHRVTKAPLLARVVVAIDPAAGDGEHGAEAGIIVAALGQDGHGYVLDDRTVRGSPDAWAFAAVTAYHTFSADRLVAETNNGGKMIEALVRTVDKTVAYKELHASRGKQARAEPVAALYEQGRVHHVGAFPHLEDQLCEWTPGDESPDRLDAAVWCLTELMLGEPEYAPAQSFNYRGTVPARGFDARRPGLRLSRRGDD